jgi:hypothetical protein
MIKKSQDLTLKDKLSRLTFAPDLPAGLQTARR